VRLRGSVFTEPLSRSGLFHCWCVYYLETAASVAQPFSHGTYMPQYQKPPKKNQGNKKTDSMVISYRLVSLQISGNTQRDGQTDTDGH
jgi:hypothetical protein